MAWEIINRVKPSHNHLQVPTHPPITLQIALLDCLPEAIGYNFSHKVPNSFLNLQSKGFINSINFSLADVKESKPKSG